MDQTEDSRYESEAVPNVIDLGCGNNPRKEAVGIDIRNYPAVAVQRDVRNLPDHWKNGVERAYASQLFEHLAAEEIAEALEEVSRVLEPGGDLIFDVPYGRAYTDDPTHETEWTFKTIVYYLPRDEVARFGCDRETFPDYFSEYDLNFKLINRDATVWLDVTTAVLRPFSFVVRQTSRAISTDKWDALPIIGNAVAGNLVFTLRVPKDE